MKRLKHAFSLLGFVFQYIVPIILFGGVIPYTHEGIAAGLTKVGYMAVIVITLIVTKKVKEKLLQREKSLARAILLSIFPIALWLIMSFFIGWIAEFVDNLSIYWNKILIFIILGRVFYAIEETMSAAEVDDGRD